MNSALAEKWEAPEEQGDQRLRLYGVTWAQYETIRGALDDRPGLRMFYLEGHLEIVSPSVTHENVKKTIARLLEIYFLEKDLELIGYGSTTFKAEAKQRGLEPDECYCFGLLKEVPEIAIEVVVSSGGIDKLAIYGGLGILEVWFWEKGRFSLYRLRETGYEKLERSEFLPEIDFTLLEDYLHRPNQHQAVKAFQTALRRG